MIVKAEDKKLTEALITPDMWVGEKKIPKKGEPGFVEILLYEGDHK